MKKHLSLAAAFLFVLTGIAGCKKDSLDKAKTDMIGQWQISKIETTPSTDLVIAGDYFDFKEGEDDIVERRLNGNLQSGTYAVTAGHGLNMTIGGNLYTCTVTTLDGSKLEFTYTQGNTSGTVHLKR